MKTRVVPVYYNDEVVGEALVELYQPSNILEIEITDPAFAEKYMIARKKES